MSAKFFHPRYWLTWIGIALLRLSIWLPWSWQMGIGKGLGKFLYVAAPSRRKISCINLEIAFPDLTRQERETLNRQHFISMGQGLMEAALSWWGSDKDIQKLTHMEGLNYLEDTIKDNRVILISAHFSSLEIGGRMISKYMPLHVVYRPHQNDLFEYLVAANRDKQYGKAIPKTQIRDMIKSIKDGYPAWYATDQNYRAKGSILVPFFGLDAPTNPSTSRLAKITGAKVLPCISVRLINDAKGRDGYLTRFLPPLDNFPSDDALQDTIRLNKILEDLIQEFPEQYLWTHKRYKHYNSELKDFYKDYLSNTPESSCKS